MSTLTFAFDSTGIPQRVAEELELFMARVQTWGNRGVAEFSSYGSFTQPRCRYFLPAAQTLTNSTDTAVAWSSGGGEFPATSQLFEVVYDNGASFGRKFLIANGQYFVPPVAGRYLVIAGAVFVANATGKRDIWLHIEQQSSAGTVAFDLPGVNMPVNSAASPTNLQVSQLVTVIDPAVGETRIRAKVYQNSGGSLNLVQGYASTYMQIEKVS